MNTALEIEKDKIKSALLEIMREQPGYFKEIFKEILEESQHEANSQQSERSQWIDQLIEEDFKKYDAVFKALA